MTTWAWKSPTGKPVFNFRSDGRSFANSVRCLIPADGFYEFTEPKAQGKKTKWLFTMAGQPWFWIAGIIKDGAFAMLRPNQAPTSRPIMTARSSSCRRVLASTGWISARPKTSCCGPARPDR